MRKFPPIRKLLRSYRSIYSVLAALEALIAWVLQVPEPLEWWFRGGHCYSCGRRVHTIDLGFEAFFCPPCDRRMWDQEELHSHRSVRLCDKEKYIAWLSRVTGDRQE